MIKRLVKPAVAVALLALLLYGADWGSAARHFHLLSIRTLVLVFGTMFGGLVLSAWKWSYALRIQGLRFPFPMLLRVLCTGFFFSSFLPTAVGGDAYRVFRTLPHDGYQSRALAAVALERAIGLFALLTLGAIAALTLMHTAPAARVYLAVTSIAALIGLAALYATYRGWVKRLTRRWEHHPAVDALLHSARLMRAHPGHWPPFIALSFAFQLVSIGIVFGLFRDLAPTVTIAQCVLITALVGVSAVMPISINGIGVMEGAFVATAVALGLDYEQALIVAIERRFIAVLLSAACGISYLLESRDEAHTGIQQFLATLRRWFVHGRKAAGESVDSTSPGTPRVPLDTAVNASGWRYSDLLEFTNDAIIIWEMDGRGILFWNRAAEDLYGYTREEARGRTTHELLRTHFDGGVRQLELMITRYGVWAGELRHTTRAGDQIRVEGRLALMSQHNGRWLVLEVNRGLADQAHAHEAQAAMAAQFAHLRAQLQR